MQRKNEGAKKRQQVERGNKGKVKAATLERKKKCVVVKYLPPGP